MTEQQLQQLDEGLGTIAKLGVGYLALRGLATLFKQRRLPSGSVNRNAVMAYAKEVANAKTDVEALIGVMGLLNVCGSLLLRVDKVRFLGQQVMQIVKSDTLKKYIDSQLSVI